MKAQMPKGIVSPSGCVTGTVRAPLPQKIVTQICIAFKSLHSQEAKLKLKRNLRIPMQAAAQPAYPNGVHPLSEREESGVTA